MLIVRTTTNRFDKISNKAELADLIEEFNLINKDSMEDINCFSSTIHSVEGLVRAMGVTCNPSISDLLDYFDDFENIIYCENTNQLIFVKRGDVSVVEFPLCFGDFIDRFDL